MKRATLFQDALFSNKLISIHALVKRATHRFATAGEAAVISIHALVKRATQGAVIATRNSPISIHALVKRATSPSSR